MRVTLKYLIFFVGLFIMASGKSQSFAGRDTLPSYIEIVVEENLNSNLKYIGYKTLKEEYLTSDHKQKLLNSMTGGLDADFRETFGINYLSRDTVFGRKLKLSLGVNHQRILGMYLPENLAILYLYGNTHLKGIEHSFDGFSYNQLSYTGFSAGLGGQLIGKRSKHFFHFTAAYIMGHEYRSFSLDKASLYTSEEADTVRLYYNGWTQRADTLYKGPYHIRGNGLGVGFRHTINSANWSLFYEIKDAGFIRWNRQPFATEKDSFLQFTGIDIPNLFDMQDSQFSNIGDSLQAQLLEESREKGLVSLLPAQFNAVFFYRLPARLSGIGINTGISPFHIRKYQLGVFPRIRFSKSFFTDIVILTDDINPLSSQLRLNYTGKGMRLECLIAGIENLAPGSWQRLNSGIIFTFVKTFKQ